MSDRLSWSPTPPNVSGWWWWDGFDGDLDQIILVVPEVETGELLAERWSWTHCHGEMPVGGPRMPVARLAALRPRSRFAGPIMPPTD